MKQFHDMEFSTSGKIIGFWGNLDSYFLDLGCLLLMNRKTGFCTQEVCLY